MKIKKLQLHNFGVYAGDNEFVFEGKKPIVLIGGMNGRGKTTFLEAVLLALYGSSSFAYSESGQKTYSGYLRSFINRWAQDQICSVKLEFEINNGSYENYIIERSWNAGHKRPKELVSVMKDGEYSEFLTSNWALFIENILPSALSSFFFFDGEKIAELAVDNTNVQLKNSIRSMLGVSVLDLLSSDIIRNLKRLNRKEKQDQTAEELQKIREEKELAAKELKELDLELKRIEKKLAGDNRSLENLHQLYITKGGDVFDKRQETIKKRSMLAAELSQTENALYTLVSEEMPLLLVSDFVNEIMLQATDEHISVIMQESIQQLDSIFAEFVSQYAGDNTAGRDFAEYVKEYVKRNQTEVIYGLSEQALFQVNNLVEDTLENTFQDAQKLLGKKTKLKKQINELDSYLTLDINEQELQSIYEKINKAEQAIIVDQVEIAELEKKRNIANMRFLAASSEFSKRVEAYLAVTEVRDKFDRITKYSNIALNVIKRYQIELQKKKIDLLAATITDCYLKLANKRTLIQNIEMDSETLEWKCLSSDGEEIPRESLSAGEKQLLVISILWALTICSKQKLPVIIDTPLSRMDSLHRTALITTYFPNAGEQAIILSTDSEIDEEYYKLMRENIGDEYTLRYDEASKSTSIQKGYLIGVKS